jgi:predicted RNA-binding protein associated with RNAse of E/G family
MGDLRSAVREGLITAGTATAAMKQILTTAAYGEDGPRGSMIGRSTLSRAERMSQRQKV